MKTIHSLSWHKRFWACGLLAGCTLAVPSFGAQSAAPRIRSEIVGSEQSTLKGSLHPLAQAQFDTGRVPADTKLSGMSLVFNRSAAQQAALDALIAAQQDPASALYHQWLTPDEFAVRFGMAQADLDKVRSWLEQQGFSIDSVARSRNLIRFSGTMGQVERAFSTQMHYYKVGGEQHFAPSTELTLPAAIAPTVEAIRNLNDFRPKPQFIPGNSGRLRPNFTSSISGGVFFAPGDIATVYDIRPLYANYTGTGQSIVVVGQSQVSLSDIENFQNAAGLTVKDPTLVLVPSTGSAAFFRGDQAESDLDLEWSSAIAPGADVYLVFAGGNTNAGAFDAIQYAIDQKIGQIISVSYGLCEPLLGGFSLESVFQQATAQGQTIVAASGDSGSTACFQGANLASPPLATQEQVAVSYPASSPNVTAIGGTEITTANAVTGTYWQAANGSDVLSSALQYIPEVAWNDDAPNCGDPNGDCLSASGGGASTLFAKPTWQAGVTGIPADGHRDVPDIALYSSPNLPGYLYCTSDTSAWSQGAIGQPAQQASCNSGFRDGTSGQGYLNVAGGTSFAAPIFAGMLAIINEKAGYSTGQGNINATLYTLASNATTYASAFHDITSGNNNCTAGSAYCSSTTGFSAGTGYDQVTGLGSIDLNSLATAWPASGGTLIGTKTTISASSTTPNVNVSDNFTITVSSQSGSTIPTGSVSLTVDGGTPITGNTLTANGTFVYTTSFATAGTHQIVAQYSGDTTRAVSTGVISINVAGTSTGTGSITLGATPSTLSVSQGSSMDETITVTPSGGYKGTVLVSFSTSNDSALANLCYNFPNITTSGDGQIIITGTAAATTQLTLDTNATDCGAAAPRTGGGLPMHSMRQLNTARNNGPNPAPLAAALAGLLLVGFLGRHSRKLRITAGLITLLAVGLAVSACGGTSSSSNPPKGTYTITVVGTDSITATITGQTTFTFTIQ